LQTVGYKEMFDYFDGLCSRDEAVELIKRNSRRYAKRQLTWFRRDEQVIWYAPRDVEGIITRIEQAKRDLSQRD
jgi:tRNA dimethylallyltransferase